MSDNFIIPPAIIMIAGAIVLPFVARTLRSVAFLIFSLTSLIVLWTLPDEALLNFHLGMYELIVVQVDPLSRIFGAIFAIIAFCGGVFAMHVHDLRQQVAALLYAGSSLGVTFAGDYLTLFIFWELMAVSSLFLIWAQRTQESDSAGMRYLIIHLFGGTLLLAGILLHASEYGITISHLSPDHSWSSWLILSGVGLNAAVPPLHAWLTDSYPKATVTGAVFLSAFTTKTAVYVLARIFAGWEILVFFGVLMTVYGVAYAVLSNDTREILAYHIISQVGYMVAGVGIGTTMAINGSTAHAFSHILYKALLFMGAGTVLQATGRSKLSDLGGLNQVMPATLILYMIGAFSISGVPLFNGFISKSMVVAAAGYEHREISFLLFQLAAIGTFLSVGIKLPYFTWFSKTRSVVPDSVPLNMHIGMGIVAVLCILFGVAPSFLYRYLPFPVEYEPFTVSHIVEAVQLLTFTFVGFWMLRAKLVGERTITLDTDWFYRRPARFLQKYVVEFTDRIFTAADVGARELVTGVAHWFRNPIGYTEKILLRSHSDKVTDDYDPDTHRPRMGIVITIVLGFFLIVAGLSLLM
jgi:multicomponent Na+:H+ antiporter subunit D